MFSRFCLHAKRPNLCISQVFIIVKGLEVSMSYTWSGSHSFRCANLKYLSIARYPHRIVNLVRFGCQIQIWRKNQSNQLSAELSQFNLKHLVVFVVKSNWIFKNFSFLAGIVELICSPWLGHFSDFSFYTETFFGANHSFLWLQHDSKTIQPRRFYF